MRIILLKPIKKNYKTLYTTLNSDFCRSAKINASILKKLRITFIIFNKKNKIKGICGLYISNYKTNELFIAIEKKIRNKGYGRKLMNRLITWSKRRKKYFFIQSFNIKTYYPALNLYFSLGYNKSFCVGNKIILMKKNYPILIVIYRIIFFYYSSIKSLILKKFIR